MQPLTISAGSAIVLGRPAKPMPQTLSDAIGAMVRGIKGIREAYLPQCFVKSVVEPPAQVLVVVLDDGADRQSVLDAVSTGLTRVLPQGQHLDVLPMTSSDGLLATVRGTRMHIHCTPPAERKQWWRIPVLLFILWFLWRVGQIFLGK
jgi:hypothetical protein